MFKRPAFSSPKRAKRSVPPLFMEYPRVVASLTERNTKTEDLEMRHIGKYACFALAALLVRLRAGTEGPAKAHQHPRPNRSRLPRSR